ncbi:MAG: hypothetical protein WA880_02825, partial [Ornithinimicrobium sp.]
GLSIALTTRAHGAPDVTLRPGARVSLVVRAGSIAFIGLLLGMVGAGVAVILAYYGVLFLCALPVLRWGARSLALLALGWGVAAPVLSMTMRPWLPAPTYDMPSPSFLLDPAQLLSEIVVTGYYPVLTWATYLFAGMAIGRLDLRSPRTAVRLVMSGLWLAVVAVSISAVLIRFDGVRRALIDTYDVLGGTTTAAELATDLYLGFFGTTPLGSGWWLGVWSPHSGSIVDLMHTTGTAMAVVGACLLVTSRLGVRARRAVGIAFGAGTMTLTLYAVHVLLLAAPESFDWVTRISVHVLLLATVGSVLVATKIRGPLELLVSEIATYAARAATDLPSPRR